MNNQATLLESDSLFHRYRRRVLFMQLKHGYEVATGFKVAREEALLVLDHLQRDGNNSLCLIRGGIEMDLKNVRGALLDVQRLYSEIAASITTVVASRTVLNRQRHVAEELHQEGLLDINEYKKIRGAVEFKMKNLTTHPPLVSMPNKVDILRKIPWLDGFNTEHLIEISNSFQDVVFQRDDILVKQHDVSDSVHVLARGTVSVITNDSANGDPIEIDELGMGSVFGEIAWVLQCPRLASIKATSPGIMFTISGEDLRRLSKSNTELERRLWQTCGYRLSENILVKNSKQSRRNLRELVHDMSLFHVDPINKEISFHNDGHVILLQGVAIVHDDLRGMTEVIEAPDILSGVAKSGNARYSVEFSTNAKYMCHPLRLVDHDEGENENFLVETSVAEMELKAARSLSRDMISVETLMSRGKRSTSNSTIKTGVIINNSSKRKSTSISLGDNDITIAADNGEDSDSSSDIENIQDF